MASPRSIEDRAESDLPTVVVKSEGVPLDRTIHITELNVSRELGRIARLTLRFIDGEPASGEFALGSSDELAPGAALEVLLGYGSDEAAIFKGIVHRHVVQLDHQGRPSLRVDAVDPAAALTLQRRQRLFEDLTDSDVVTQIGEEAGLSVSVPATDVTHRELVQYGGTDWDFIVTRLEANGLFALTGLGKLEGVRPDTSRDPALVLEYGATLLEFEAELDARVHSASVQAEGWSSDEQELVSVDASDPGIKTAGNLAPDDVASIFDQPKKVQSGAALERDELQEWATSLRARQRLGHVRGRARVRGNVLVVPGDIVEVLGLGDRMSGRHFVSGVHHRYRAGEWVTEYSIGAPTTPFSERVEVNRPRAAGLAPAMSGLQIGVVSALEGDPDGRERIRVRLPLLDPDSEGIWARLATLSAGDQRGFAFRPEVDDEVVVGFCDDDPRAPIVLGSLHSAARTPAVAASDDNDVSAYTTKSGIELRFDEADVVVTLSTPNGNQLRISDADGGISLSDENGNELTLGPDGIALKSASDVVIDAGADISLTATGNIDGGASGSATLKGGTGTEVSSDGNTTVKGALVLIN